MTDDYAKANHNPVAMLNGDTTRQVLKLHARAGETVALSSAGSRDPDGDAITSHWMIYTEPGTLVGECDFEPNRGNANPSDPSPPRLRFSNGGNPPCDSHRSRPGHASANSLPPRHCHGAVDAHQGEGESQEAPVSLHPHPRPKPLKPLFTEQLNRRIPLPAPPFWLAPTLTLRLPSPQSPAPPSPHPESTGTTTKFSR